MPPRRQPYSGSIKEPGIRLCPHTCENPGSRCDPGHVYAKAGNSCRRHAKTEKLHPNCNKTCPAHSKRKNRILERIPTRADWMAMTPELRATLKDNYKATTPPDSEDEEQDEEEEDEEDEEDEDEEVEQVSPFSFHPQEAFAFIF